MLKSCNNRLVLYTAVDIYGKLSDYIHANGKYRFVRKGWLNGAPIFIVEKDDNMCIAIYNTDMDDIYILPYEV